VITSVALRDRQVANYERLAIFTLVGGRPSSFELGISISKLHLCAAIAAPLEEAREH